MVLYCCNVFHSMLLLEIQIVSTTTTSVGYGLMSLLSVLILRHPLPEGTTTVQRVKREIMQHGARIMRWGRLGHRQMQSGMKTNMMAMHDNVQFMLVKLCLKADMSSCGTGQAEGSLVRSGFILNT